MTGATNRRVKIWATLGCLFLYYGCSTTKYLKEDQKLHARTEIELTDEPSADLPRSVKKDLETVIYPKLNNKFRLRFYNFMAVPNGVKSPWRWLGRKIGQPPVIYDHKDVENSRINLQTYLRNKGFLDAIAAADTSVNGKKVEVTYELNVAKRYTIQSCHFPSDTLGLPIASMDLKSETVLAPGQYMDRNTLDRERIRVVTTLNDSGYVDLTDTHLFYLADTNHIQKTVDLYLMVNSLEGNKPFRRYHVGHTTLDANYSLKAPAHIRDSITIREGVTAIDSRNIIKEKYLDRIIRQRRGAVYNPRLQELASRNLVNLGLFKFSQVDLEADTSGEQAYIHRHFKLTPTTMQQITGTLEVNTWTGNFLGSSASVSYQHNNLLRGAEQFKVSLSGGLATQLNAGSRLINTSNVNLDMGLRIPRFIGPVPFRGRRLRILPQTDIGFGIGMEERRGFYGIQTGNMHFGYEWQDQKGVKHDFRPVSFQLFNLVNSTAEFDAIRSLNRRLDQSINDVLIGGLRYLVSWSRKSKRRNAVSRFFNAEFESSGSFLNLVNDVFSGDGSDHQATLFGSPISQFVKGYVDYRIYHQYGRNSLILRWSGGAGFAFGNSEFMPYSRQFTAGGANGIRAFQLRSLGPGSFVPTPDPDIPIDNQFLDQTGNLKLEMNVEYRFPLFGYLKGAVFMDAGNIWVTGSSMIPEGEFQLGDLVDELAIGTGLGLRLDFTYFVIRLDGSFPLRRPVRGDGFRWTFGEIDLFDGGWRGDHLVWHLALGYPF